MPHTSSMMDCPVMAYSSVMCCGMPVKKVPVMHYPMPVGNVPHTPVSMRLQPVMSPDGGMMAFQVHLLQMYLLHPYALQSHLVDTNVLCPHLMDAMVSEMHSQSVHMHAVASHMVMAHHVMSMHRVLVMAHMADMPPVCCSMPVMRTTPATMPSTMPRSPPATHFPPDLIVDIFP